jgi:hypothetical protein
MARFAPGLIRSSGTSSGHVGPKILGTISLVRETPTSIAAWRRSSD